jgi:hypothetical protein
MKNIFILFIFTLTCQAQNIQPYFQNTGFGKESDVYYKDLDNDFTPYVGTWKYTNGTTSLTIVLQKRQMVNITIGSTTFFRDYLVGEYSYIENGVEKINTLPSLTSNFTDMFNYNLTSSGIVTNKVFPKCNDCSPNQRRISMFFNEPSRREIVGLTGGLMLKQVTENGVVKIKAIIYARSPSLGFTVDDIPTSINSYTVPFGEYLLVKQ